MEKSTNRELWVGYRHPANGTSCVRWFSSDKDHTARQKAEVFMKNSHESRNGKIMENAKTAEEALSSYGG